MKHPSDLFVVIGSSRVVTPAAEMIKAALMAGVRRAIINQGETPFGSQAHLRFYEGIGEIL